MKEPKFGIPSISWFGCLLILLTLSSFVTAQTGTESKDWYMDQELLFNPFYNWSPIDLSDETGTLPLTDEILLPLYQSLEVTSPELYGLRGAASITQSVPGYWSFNKLIDHRSAMQLQAKASYSSKFYKGNVNLWLGALWNQQEVNSIITGVRTDQGNFGYNIGIGVNYADFGLTGSYYNDQAPGDLYFNPYMALDSSNCFTGECAIPDNQGYILKGTYALTKGIKFGISYGESSGYNHINNTADFSSELWTVGLYHDFNSWLKFRAEYSNYRYSNYGFDDTSSDMISIGGNIRW